MSSLDPAVYLKGFPFDYYTDFSRVKSYFSKDFRTITPQKKKISDDVLKRIESYNRRIKADSKVFENIEILKDAAPVVTGQQPCLLTGPLFVVYKALTAIVVAEKYHTVPIFWNASEDDDVSEVNHIWVMNKQLQKIAVDLEMKPFSKIVLSLEDIQNVLTQFEGLTPSTEFREKIMNKIRECSQSFSEMFSQLLSHLFADYGLIMVEPYIFADLAIPVYKKLIDHPTKAVALVNSAGDSVEKEGYKRQLYKSNQSCSFYLSNDTRHAVIFDGVFHVNGDTYSKQDLLDLLDANPECFTSTVISRPLVQDFLFSTLAYCAGPGEVSYFAQMKSVYDFFEIEEPSIVPRIGVTMVEKKVQKTLEKFKLEVSDLIDSDRILKHLARKDTSEFFSKKKIRILKTIKEMEEYMASVDFNLKKTAAAMKVHIAQDLRILEEKTASALKNQNQIAEEQIKRASLNVFPHRMLQERVLNIFQYLIRYESLLQTLYCEFQRAQPGEHILIYPGD